MKETKTGKVPSPLGFTNDMLKILGKVRCGLVKHIVNQIVHEGVILNDQCSSITLSCYKDKGDGLDRSS